MCPYANQGHATLVPFFTLTTEIFRYVLYVIRSFELLVSGTHAYSCTFLFLRNGRLTVLILFGLSHCSPDLALQSFRKTGKPDGLSVELGKC